MEWLIALWCSIGLLAGLSVIAIAVCHMIIAAKPDAPDRRRLREREGYKGDIDKPTLKGGTCLEPVIGHLALLTRQLAEEVGMEQTAGSCQRIAEEAKRVEDFFRVRWDAPEEPEKPEECGETPPGWYRFEGRWYHVVADQDAIYVDGQLVVAVKAHESPALQGLPPEMIQIVREYAREAVSSTP